MHAVWLATDGNGGKEKGNGVEDGAEGERGRGGGGGDGPWRKPWREEVEVGRASGSEGVTRWGYLWTASPSLAPPFFSEGRGSCSSSSSSSPPLLWPLSPPLLSPPAGGCPPFLSLSRSLSFDSSAARRPVY
jgi:hypothetical protein